MSLGDQSVGIEGAGETLINEDADRAALGTPQGRLLVTDRMVPDIRHVHQFEYLENGGSNDMTVNGNVTPVSYEAGPPLGQIWWITSLSLFIQDPGTSADTVFGSLGSALGDGVLIEWTTTAAGVGAGIQYANLQDNTDIVMTFGSETYAMANNNGFMNSNDSFFGFVKFHPPLRLVGNTEILRATVRDNLNQIANLRIGFNYVREIT